MINPYFKNIKNERLTNQIEYLSQVCVQIEGKSQYRLFIESLGKFIRCSTKAELLDRCLAEYSSSKLPNQVIKYYIQNYLMTVKCERYMKGDMKLYQGKKGWILNTFEINPLYDFFEDRSIPFFRGQRKGQVTHSRTSTIHNWNLYKDSDHYSMDFDEFHHHLKDAGKYINLEPGSNHYQYTGYMRMIHLGGGNGLGLKIVKWDEM